MNESRLAALGANAKAWAKAYTLVVEALMAEGVPEVDARREARAAANMAAFMDDVPEVDECPGCGEKGGELTTQGDRERKFACRCGAMWTAPFGDA
jgi:hypothetical protein